eukprot:scaffold2529_cov122-Isochrysis_galbana.AAC.20
MSAASLVTTDPAFADLVSGRPNGLKRREASRLDGSGVFRSDTAGAEFGRILGAGGPVEEGAAGRHSASSSPTLRWLVRPDQVAMPVIDSPPSVKGEGSSRPSMLILGANPDKPPRLLVPPDAPQSSVSDLSESKSSGIEESASSRGTGMRTLTTSVLPNPTTTPDLSVAGDLGADLFRSAGGACRNGLIESCQHRALSSSSAKWTKKQSAGVVEMAEVISPKYHSPSAGCWAQHFWVLSELASYRTGSILAVGSHEPPSMSQPANGQSAYLSATLGSASVSTADGRSSASRESSCSRSATSPPSASAGRGLRVREAMSPAVWKARRNASISKSVQPIAHISGFGSPRVDRGGRRGKGGQSSDARSSHLRVVGRARCEQLRRHVPKSGGRDLGVVSAQQLGHSHVTNLQAPPKVGVRVACLGLEEQVGRL